MGNSSVSVKTTTKRAKTKYPYLLERRRNSGSSRRSGLRNSSRGIPRNGIPRQEKTNYSAPPCKFRKNHRIHDRVLIVCCIVHFRQSEALRRKSDLPAGVFDQPAKRQQRVKVSCRARA